MRRKRAKRKRPKLITLQLELDSAIALFEWTSAVLTPSHGGTGFTHRADPLALGDLEQALDHALYLTPKRLNQEVLDAARRSVLDRKEEHLAAFDESEAVERTDFIEQEREWLDRFSYRDDISPDHDTKLGPQDA